MLVLRRALDQSIIIGDNIKIKILAVRGDMVSLGIEAPKEISVHREEIYKLIKQEEKDEQK